jgi:hypothetical protein
MVILLFLGVAAAQPSSEALRLGRELADHGTLAALLPLLKAKEIAELVADHKQLSPADQAQLRETAEKVFNKGRDRILSATGQAYAKQLSVGDLRKLVAFYRTPAAARFQAALPKVIGDTAVNMGTMDFKSDVITAYCKDTGKLCGK